MTNLVGTAMQLSVTLFDLVVLLGFIQGIVMATVLYLKRIDNRGKSLFSFILLILSLLSFKILLHTLGLWNTPLFRYFPLAIDTTLQPLLLLYIISITRSKIGRPYTALLFVPTVAFMLYALAFYGRALSKPNLLLEDGLANELYFNWVKSAEDWVAVFSAIAYWVIGYRLILRYRKWVFDTQSDSNLQELSWLKNLVLLSGILVAAVTAVVVLDDTVYTGKHNFIHLQLFYTYLAIITYYLSFKGYQLYQTSLTISLAAVEQQANDLLADANAVGKITRESEIEFEVLRKLIIHAMEVEKLYLNAELSIKELARHISIPVASVSATINHCFQINFRNLINKYRVEEVKKCLCNPPSHLSVLGIALDCGFNSEASFYRIFRQHTGQSPSNYIQNTRDKV